MKNDSSVFSSHAIFFYNFQKPLTLLHAVGSALYIMHVHGTRGKYKEKKIIGIKRIFFFFYKQFAQFVLWREKNGRAGTKKSLLRICWSENKCGEKSVERKRTKLKKKARAPRNRENLARA